MSVLNRPYFYDEKSAFEHVESILWPEGPVCPHCGNVDKHYKLEGVRSKPSKKNPEGIERHGLYKCAACRKQFTVRIGTIFEESHLPLHKWLQAIHLVCSSKKGISANQLHRTLEVTLKTAWFLGHRIREAMRRDTFSLMGGGGNIVEIDETYTGKRDDLTPQVVSRVEAALAVDEECEGAIQGNLEQINLHLGANTFHVYPDVGPKKVTCHFPARLYDEAITAVGRKVEVSGTLRYRARTAFPHQIQVASIDAFPPEYELPDWDDLRGRAPDATGELSSEEFVRELRDGWR